MDTLMLAIQIVGLISNVIVMVAICRLFAIDKKLTELIGTIVVADRNRKRESQQLLNKLDDPQPNDAADL